MKLVIARDVLHAALSVVARIVEKKGQTIPILSNVWLGAGDGALKLRATDLDIEAEASCPARVSTPGEITVDAATLRGFADKTPTGAEMSLEMDASQLVVRAGRSKFRLNTLPASDFPDLASIEPSHSFSLSAKDFDRLLAKSAFAMSDEETRYYLNGVFLHAVDGCLRAAATNGHQLAKVEGSSSNGAGGMPGIILPRKAVAELMRLCDKATGIVDIAVSAAKISVRFPNGVRLTSKLVDGTFPDYGRVIPTAHTRTCDFDRAALMAATERVSALVGTGGKSKMRLQMTPALEFEDKHGVMRLEITSPDAGSSTDEIDCHLIGDEIGIGMNPRYMLDILGAMSGERARFLIQDPGAPVVVRDLGDEGVVFVVMPLM